MENEHVSTFTTEQVREILIDRAKEALTETALCNLEGLPAVTRDEVDRSWEVRFRWHQPTRRNLA